MAESDLLVTSLSSTFGLLIQSVAHGLHSVNTAQIATLFKQHGALLLRGFETKVEDFLWLSDALSSEFSTYRGGGLRWGPLDRQSIAGNNTLLTVTGATQGFPILLHGEMYYLKKHPSILWFYCERAAEKGGETILCDGELLLNRLKASTQHFFRSAKIKYLRRLNREECKVAFQTEDLEELKSICAENETSLQISSDENIETAFVCSAIAQARGSGTEVFVNNLAQMYVIEWAFDSGWIRNNMPDLPRQSSPMIVRMEDGSRLPSAIFDEIHQLYQSLAIPVCWQDGDLLMIDNTRLLHGRNEATGTRRNIMVRMSEPAFAW